MRDFLRLKTTWEFLAKTDPFWSILTQKEMRGNLWDKVEFFKTGVDEINELMAKLEKWDIEFERQIALDFGCGVGRLTLPLTNYFERVIGVDISANMIQLANQYSNDKSSFVWNKEQHLSIFADEYFDFVYSNIVLQHNHPQLIFIYLKELFRVLKKGGLIVFQLPDRTINPLIDLLRNSKLSQKYLYRLYLLIRYGLTPVMETYSVRREVVVSELINIGFELIKIEENRNAGPKWISYMYYARKK